MKELKGLTGAPGLALGRAYLHRTAERKLTRTTVVDPMAAFGDASQAVAAELNELARGIAQRSGPDAAAIMEAQAFMATDPALQQEVEDRLAQGQDLFEALEGAGEALAAVMAGQADPYLRERAADVLDVTQRILAHLSGGGARLNVPYLDTVIVAPDLLPSEVAGLAPDRVRGLVLAEGSPTCHSSLIARALGIPAVVACRGALEAIPDGSMVGLDAGEGIVWVEPQPGVLADLEQRQQRQASAAAELESLRDLPAVSASGEVRATLLANLGSVAECQPALAAGAEGVGLFRTEFLLLDRPDLAGEEEQYQAYRTVLEAFAGKPVTIRTFDVGGDKQIPGMSLPHEANPFLGLRGVRLWLAKEEIWRPQTRALLRAAAHGDLRIMLPMIATVDEVLEARRRIAAVAEELGEAVGPFQVGIMIEIPAAALLADELARHVDFFSIGTNDLIQYTMAADRTNAAVAHLYQPLHAGVLRLIRMTAEAGANAGIETSVCGDMAGDQKTVPALLEAGIRKLSMTPRAIPQTKQQIRLLP